MCIPRLLVCFRLQISRLVGWQISTVEVQVKSVFAYLLSVSGLSSSIGENGHTHRCVNC